jgi:type I restriction enzyme S subunit
MKAEWKSDRVEDLIQSVAIPAKLKQTQFLKEGPVPIVSQEAQAINGYWNSKQDAIKVDTPLVVFGDHTQALKYVDYDFVVGADGVKILKPKATINPRFFYYQLQTLIAPSLGYARHYRILRDKQFTYPNLPEQARIVAILDQALNSIEQSLESSNLKILKSRALLQRVIDSTFGEDSHGDLIPLSNVCEFENGDRGKNYPSKRHRTLVGIPFINAGHLMNRQVCFDKMDFIPPNRYELLSNGKIQAGDILFCLRGSVGKFASVGTIEAGAIASSLVICRPTKTILAGYLLAYFESHRCAQSIQAYKGGAAQPNLGAANLAKFELPVPTLECQRTTVSRIEDLRSQKS